MSDTEQVKSNRERYAERLKSKYPDREYADDEALFGQINDDYDDYDKQLEEYVGREKALADWIASNPRSAAFLIDWRNGEDPIVGLVRKFGGDNIKDMLEDPEKAEALAEANKEYAERIAEEDGYETQYLQNLADTFDTLKQVQQEDMLTDEEIDNAFAFLFGIMRDGVLGKFSAESLRMALKALNHDADVEQADLEGEVRGRNTKIEEKLRKRASGDGTANLAGKNGGATPPPVRPMNIFKEAEGVY